MNASQKYLGLRLFYLTLAAVIVCGITAGDEINNARDSYVAPVHVPVSPVDVSSVPEVSSKPENKLTVQTFHRQLDKALEDLITTAAGGDSLLSLGSLQTLLRESLLPPGTDEYFKSLETALGQLQGLAKAEADASDIVAALEAADRAKKALSLKDGYPSGELASADGVWPRAVSACLERGRIRSDELVMTFAGDTSMGTLNGCPPENDFNAVMKRKASNPLFPFQNAQPWFQTDDLTIINLEGVLTNATKPNPYKLTFKGIPEYAAVLKNTGVDVSCLANNHTFDYYRQGYDETVDSLKKANIFYYNTDKIFITEKAGKTICLIGYDVRGTQDKPYIFSKVFELIDKVKREQKPDLLILSLHWGKEHYHYPLDYQKKYSRLLIDRGVDLLIGTHAHVIQGIEQYKGKTIVYNLGNFCLGDTEVHSIETVLFRQRYRVGNGKMQDIGFELIPFHVSTTQAINDFEPVPQYGKRGDAIIQSMLAYSDGINRDGIKQVSYFQWKSAK